MIFAVVCHVYLRGIKKYEAIFIPASAVSILSGITPFYLGYFGNDVAFQVPD
jgi:hypothetical protein